MTPIDYDKETAMFMAAMYAYGLARAGDHVAAEATLKEAGIDLEEGAHAGKSASGVVIGLYCRALLQLREAQVSDCSDVNDAIEALAACHNDKRVIVYHHDVDWSCAVPGPDGHFLGEPSYGDNPIDAIMAAVRLMRVADKQASDGRIGAG